MKKSFKRIGIIWILILILFATVYVLVNTSNATTEEYKETDMAKIENFTGGRTDTTTEAKVQLGSSNRGSLGGYNEEAENHVLNQRNIFCVQRNIAIYNGSEYTIGDKYQVQSQALAYILAHGPYDGTGNEGEDSEKKYRYDGAQIALWEYLSVFKNSTDVRNIMGTINPTRPDRTFYNESAGKPLYEEAIAHEQTYNNINGYLDVTSESNHIIITVKGNFESYTLSVDGQILNLNQAWNDEENTTYGYIGEQADRTYKIKAKSNGEKSEIKLNIKVTKYKVCLRTLSRYENQRLIVVTGVETEEVTQTITKYAGSNTNVSLEKYITKKGTSETLNSLTSDDILSKKVRKEELDYDMTKRWSKLASENSIYKDAQGNDTFVPTNCTMNNYVNKDKVMAPQNMKYYNPVKAESGDYIQYQINVYNNDINTTTAAVSLKDYIHLLDENGNIIKQLTLGTAGSNAEAIVTDIKAAWANNFEFAGVDNPDDNKQNAGQTIPYTDGGFVYAKTENDNTTGNKITWKVEDNQLKIDNIKFYDGYKGLKKDGYSEENDNICAIKFIITIKYNTDEKGIIRNYTELGGGSTQYRRMDADYIEIPRETLSLQKYITQISGSPLYSIDTPITERSLLYDNKDTDTLPVYKDANNYLVYPSRNDYKMDNPVRYEPGDTITYNIIVYNNTNKTKQNIYVYDYLSIIDKSGNDSEKILTDNDYEINEDNITIYSGSNSGEEENDITCKIVLSSENNSENNIEQNAQFIIDKLDAGQYVTISVNIKFNIQIEDDELIKNYAYIQDGASSYRQEDADYIKVKKYAASLEKYVIKVHGTELIQDGIPLREGKAEHAYDNDESTISQDKYNNVVEVAKGNLVSYTIKVRNDGDTDTLIAGDKDNDGEYIYDYASFRVPNITDYLPDGVKYNSIEYKGGQYNQTTNNSQVFSNISNILIKPGGSAEFDITVEVIEPNISLNILKNTAEITDNILKNTNGYEIEDTTPNDNKDSDYIQMQDIPISGIAWNDRALNKTQNEYNGKYDENGENKLSGIKVNLYRKGASEDTLVDTKYTQDDGKYTFTTDFIKGPKEEGTNRWAGTYYSYYVVFEYDGVKYTSTTYTDYISADTLDSNAREKLNDETFDGKATTTRTAFNERISSGISNRKYITKNEDGNIPESNYIYNYANMRMQSSTKLIELKMDEALEELLKHINIGLRGRDVFDLELTSDVDNVKVTVNGKQGVYKYTNKVTIRRNDLSGYEYAEDMANLYSKESQYVGEDQNQYIRNMDLDVTKANANVDGKEETIAYEDSQGLSNIEVTYRITVLNTSKTVGTATKIINYYDNNYHINTDKGKVAYYYDDSGNKQWILADNISEGDSGTGFKSVVITTPGTMLNQSETMDIYVVYTLNEPKTTLAGLLEGKPLPTYNMAEIAEYSIKTETGEKELTKGLMDKDSAPGSANKEQVRLTTTSKDFVRADGTIVTEEESKTPTTLGNPTTVQYYFNKKLDENKDNSDYLKNLKYEDDTYATPTLYFVKPSETDTDGDEIPDNEKYIRIITGTVFEDYTRINGEYIKSGNGIKDEEEPTIAGITVQLIEGDKIRDITQTDENGNYTFANFLPGDYIIRYYYGDTEKTFLKNYNDNGNEESYNGEEFQSTNNSHDVYGIAVNKLSTRENFWYADNETKGISVAIDNLDRRNTVSEKAIGFSIEEMKLLNRAKAGEQLSGIGSISDETSLIGKTYMFADTPKMVLTVEKSELVDGEIKQRDQFSEYKISNMNFGIAEVPVTTIDLQKEVQSFTIIDATGKNVIAKATRVSPSEWDIDGVVIAMETSFDASIEDTKLQGARLQVTYSIKANKEVEINYDTTDENPIPTIKNLIDIVDNDLVYNESLNNNSGYWNIRTEALTTSSVENISSYNTILNATSDTIQKLNNNETVYITLEKVLSSTDATLDEIITSTVDIYEYGNTVEIIELDYGEETNPRKDRVRLPDDEDYDDEDNDDGYIIKPSVMHDTATSEIITIHPPTGASGIDTMYYVVVIISLIIIVAGAFSIKKFVLNNKE